MGCGFSGLLCFKSSSSSPAAKEIVLDSFLDETLGHSFCYIPSPSHSARFISPSDSLRFSEAALRPPETAFKSISGASVGANTSTPRTVLQPELIYHNATDPLTKLTSTGFESSASFSAIPLQPLPRLESSGPLDRPCGGGGFMSGPIERGALSGPLDPSIHFSAPLGGGGGGGGSKKRNKKSFSGGGGGVRTALARSFSEKKRPWVVPVLNFVGRKDAPSAAAPPDSDGMIEGELSKNVHWAHGKAGEDRVHVVISEDRGWLFVGIYDGFNGPDAPEFLMGNLYRALFDELEGLFWEKIQEDDGTCLVIQQGDDSAAANEAVVEGRTDPSVEISELSETTNDLQLQPPLNSGSVKRVTIQSEQEMGSSARRKTLWEFLAEEADEEAGELDLSASDRFAFSDDNPSSLAKRSSILLSKLKYGLSRQKERNRKLFPWIFDWEDKDKVGVDNPVEDRSQQTCRRSKVGPVDPALVLRALSQALKVTELAYLDMTDMVLDQNPEVALMGSCLLVVLMKDEDVYVMNVGDSRALVAQYQPQVIGSTSDMKGRGNGGQEIEGIVEESAEVGGRASRLAIEELDQVMKLTALQLSTDHSTSIKEEVLRIKEEHPDDSQCIVNDRVKGRLKVTRAFGAGYLKQPKWNNALLEMFRNEYIGTEPYITCSPSLRHHKLGPSDQFLVLSSDGLYQYLTNQEVVSQVENFMEKFPDGDPAQHLIEELLIRAAKKAGMDFHELLDIPQGDRRKYHDDVTVMVISLEGRIWKSSGKYL
ncbi:protein phosphatase 2C 29 [Cinnamomum micranthum f. kanehirae]|uniref:Protein phosphatase 2C 29 n=1 Tax=Cinnamomum micranthum f. kanehirae TaxID=337451 RepID=A0A443NPZ5_9MAGN|nr:protein phosphatase 2C 29 [Cinnamomum micranthum f. kanehirae]